MYEGYEVLPTPKNDNIQLLAGDTVLNAMLGIGVVVGFCVCSGEPYVFFYSQQKMLCISKHEVTRINAFSRFPMQTQL